jgi:uncharacterized protein (DUF433 family)
MEQKQPSFRDRIATNPEILVGKPTIKGTRISVALVLGYLAHNLSFDEFFTDYPDLTIQDVQACLAYAEAMLEGDEVLPPRPHRAKG